MRGVLSFKLRPLYPQGATQYPWNKMCGLDALETSLYGLMSLEVRELINTQQESPIMVQVLYQISRKLFGLSNWSCSPKDEYYFCEYSLLSGAVLRQVVALNNKGMRPSKPTIQPTRNFILSCSCDSKTKWVLATLFTGAYG
jgi:hypothetical protein